MSPTRARRPLPMLSPSRLDLAEECLYPWTSGIDWPEDDSSDASVFGTAVHAIADWLVESNDRDAIPLAVALASAHYELSEAVSRRLRDRVDTIAALLDEEVWDHRQGEARLAYDPQTGDARELRLGDERRGGEMVLVIDVLLHSGATVLVRDWKTGRRPAIRRVEDSQQVRAYALGAAKVWGFDAVIVELCWLSDRGVWTDRSRFDLFDFDVIEHQLRRLDDDRRRGCHEPRLGLHCVEHYCPIRSLCPMALAAAEAVYADAALRHPVVTDELRIADHDHARELLERIPIARATLDAAESALRDFVLHKGPVDLGEGKAWGAVEKIGKEDVACTNEAQAVLIEALGEHAALAIETRTETSKSAIDRAIRAKTTGGKRGAQKRLRDPLHARLREVGALRRGAPYTSFEAFKRPEPREETTT